MGRTRKESGHASRDGSRWPPRGGSVWVTPPGSVWATPSGSASPTPVAHDRVAADTLFVPEALEEVARVIRARQKRTHTSLRSLVNLRPRAIPRPQGPLFDDGTGNRRG